MVGDIGGDFAQTIHVIGKADEFGGDVGGEAFEGVHNHGGAGDFAECADMGEAAGAVAGFERDVAFGGGDDLAAICGAEAFDDLLGFFEGPCAGF